VQPGRSELTPSQDKAIGKIQRASVAWLIIVSISMGALHVAHTIDTWQLLVVGLPVMLAVVPGSGLLISRVEQRAVAEVMHETIRAMGDDLEAAPARLGRRVAHPFAHRHSH
jgi:hypothetical protein